MSASFIDSVKSQDESDPTSNTATGAKKNLSDAEIKLIQSAVSGEKERRNELSKSQSDSESLGDLGGKQATPSTTASDAPSSLPETTESCESDSEDTYHKPDKKKYKLHKQTPWVWIAILIIITVAILYSWYDYTKQNNSRKDVRAFVAAMMIIIAAVLLYLLVK